MEIGDYSFVHSSVKTWNHLPAESIVTFLINPKTLGRDLGKQL